MAQATESATQSDAAEVFAIIRDMAVGPDVSSVRVFVNAPALSATTPLDSAHFAGEIGFLAHPEAEGEHAGHQKTPPSALIELTDTVRDLAKRGLLTTDNISVQLVPVLREGAKDGAGATIIPASIEIVVV